MSIKDLIFLPAAYFSVVFSANVYATNFFVSSYFDSSRPPAPAYWSGLAAAAQIVPTTIIINPDNGFGTNADPGYVTAIEQIYNYIKNKSGQYSVMGDPGVVPDEIYLSKAVADNLLVFQDSMRSYVNFKPEQWQRNYPKGRFIHIVYNAT